MHKKCFYCGGAITEKTGIGDHFPVPKRHGGEVTVDCCKSCHDMKDRITLGDWPIDWVTKAYKELRDEFWFQKRFSRETRIYIAKILALTLDLGEKFKT